MEPPNLYPVKLYVYDLSKGLARRLSPIMLGEGTGVSGKFCRDGKRGPRVRVGWGSLTPLFQLPDRIQGDAYALAGHKPFS